MTAEFDTGEHTASRCRRTTTTSSCATINEVIKDAKSDGSYDEIYKKWFGTAPES